MRPKNDADWYRKFDESVPPPKRRQLATFKDAGTYITLQMTLYCAARWRSMATMDKQTFLNLAPEYYMLALCEHLQYPRNYYTEASWRKAFTFQDHEEYCYVENAALRAEAVRLMAKPVGRVSAA